MKKLSKPQVFLIALVLGLLIGNFLTTINHDAAKKLLHLNESEILGLLYRTKLNSNKDSIWYNNEIQKLSDTLYEAEIQNKELKEKLLSKTSPR